MCDPAAGSQAIQCASAIARTGVPSHHGPMAWTTPSYEEIKMDAEIGSYQEDFEPERDPIADADAAAADAR